MKRLLIVLGLVSIILTKLEAHPPWGIAVDKQQNIYFTDILHHGKGTIWKLSSNGVLSPLLKEFHAHYLGLDTQGYLIVANGEDDHTMLRLDSTGQVLDTLYHTTDHQEFFGGNCTYTPQGDIVFGTKHFLWSIDANRQKRKLSDHRFEWNQAVYAAPDGYIYAPDIGVGRGTLLEINPQGQASVLASNLISDLGRPVDPHADVLLGMYKGTDSSVYLAETAGQQIIKVLSDGTSETFYKATGDWMPTGITFFKGEAFILEFEELKVGMGGPRITKRDVDGTCTVVFDYTSFLKLNGNTIQEEEQDMLNSYIYIGLILLGLVIVSFIAWRTNERKIARG